MRLLFLVFLLSELIASGTVWAAGGQDTAPPSIFAYPGKTCPGGSELYKGPELTLAEASGAVYCRFFRKVMVIPKNKASTCPSGTKTHVEKNAKPDDDVLWCEHDGSAGPAGLFQPKN